MKSNCLDSIEIGVHHGKFFIGIENITPKKNRCIAIDIFSSQGKNVDGSGSGSLSLFNENVSKYAVNPERVLAIELDSLDINRELLGKHKFGIISIDGGHTENHTISDLITAQELMHEQGIVILDDILNQDWTGVITGASIFFRSAHSNRMVPFAIGFNKLFCCHFSISESVKKNILNDRESLLSINIKPFKMTQFMGF